MLFSHFIYSIKNSTVVVQVSSSVVLIGVLQDYNRSILLSIGTCIKYFIIVSIVPVSRSNGYSLVEIRYYCINKNQSTPRPSEHPPVMGGKMSKRLGGIKGCKYKTSSWHLNRFPDADNIGSTV